VGYYSLKMEEQKQCACCSCRCDRLENELKKQIKINHNLKALVFQIKDISANFDSLYNSIMDDTQALGTSIQLAENELNELEDKNPA